jgi:methyl-accepting chemotaxis protein
MNKFFLPARMLASWLQFRGGVSLSIGLLLLAQVASIWMGTEAAGQSALTTGILWRGVLCLIVLFAVYLLAGLAIAHSRSLDHLRTALERMASGDFSEGATVRERALSETTDTGRILNALAQMRANLIQIVNQVRAGAEHIANGAHQIAAGYTDLSQRTEEQASTLEETAASMEELSATVRQNEHSCRQADASAQEAGERAEEVVNSVHGVTSTMTRIEESSRKMSEIIGMIEGIAFQTNILALNAAVEAARAGEHGRGFTVVATEVRTLAQRSAQASEEVRGLIQLSAKDVVEGAELVARAEHAVQRAATAVRDVSERIRSIATASQEQSAGVDGIGKAVTRLEQVTQQNAALVEEGVAASTAFAGEAARLMDAVGAFKLDRVTERDQAVALVKRGVEHVRAVGTERALKDFHDPRGGFVEGECYIYAFNHEGVLLASPFRPDLLGVDQSEHVDHDGKKYVREILRIARTMGRGWCDYRSTNPVTRRPEAKSAYIECTDDLIIGCGIYSDETEQNVTDRSSTLFATTG